MTNLNNKQKDAGFTLVEVLAAIFVFVVGITAVIYLVSKEIHVVKASDDRMTAIYLAQEGIELVRNLREENWLNGRGWRTGPATPTNDRPCNIPPGALATDQCNYDLDDTVIEAEGYIIDYTSALAPATLSPPDLCFYPGDRLGAPPIDPGDPSGPKMLGFVYVPGCDGADPRFHFRRVIYFTADIFKPEELRVQSVVYWGSPVRTFEISETMKDWNKQD